MKTTVEIPDPLFRSAKVAAARQGRSLKSLFVEALEVKLAPLPTPHTEAPPWMTLFGAFGADPTTLADSRKIDRRIAREFERIEPEDEE